MSKHETAAQDLTEEYTGNTDAFPVVFAQLRGEGGQSTTLEGDATVAVNGDELTLTLTAEFEEPGRLIDRDMLSVELVGKDLPEGSNDE